MQTVTSHEKHKIQQERVLKVIDKALTQIFGIEATNLIYGYIEENHRVRKDEIVEKLEHFTRGLEEFLSTGAYVIEKKILEDIYSDHGLIRRLESEQISNQLDFVSQVKLIITSK